MSIAGSIAHFCNERFALENILVVAKGFAIGAGEVWEIPNASFGEFTASETPGLETYFLFVRPLSGGLELEGVEESLRENFVGTRANGGSQGSGSETAAERLDRFERWLTARYASVDRVEIRVAD